MSEYFVEILRNVCRCWMMRVVVLMTVRWRARDGERQRHDRALGRQNKRILYHGARPRVMIWVLNGLDLRLLSKR